MELLTEKEYEAVRVATKLWNLYKDIVGNGVTRTNDLNEFALHIHAIQQAILTQAAARAYPTEFRLLGEVIKK